MGCLKMASQYSSAEIFELQSNKHQFQEWDANEADADFVSHTKKAAAVAFQRELSEKQKKYYADYYLNGLSMAEIANIHGINKATVSRTITRANKKLRTVLRYSAPHLLMLDSTIRNRRAKDGN